MYLGSISVPTNAQLPTDEESADNRSPGRKREHSDVSLQLMAWGLDRLCRSARPSQATDPLSSAAHQHPFIADALADCGKLFRHRRTSMACTSWTRRKLSRRELKMASQQGRRELGDRSVFFPPAHPELPRQLYHRGGTLQGDGRLRTTPGERCVLARRGWAGEKKVIFSIRLVRWRQHRYHAQRPAGSACNFHRQSDHIEFAVWKIS